MYSEQIEQLIKSVIADGVITEKERAVLHKRAAAEGIDEDEIDVYVDGLIAQMKVTAPDLRTPITANIDLKFLDKYAEDNRYVYYLGQKFYNVKRVSNKFINKIYLNFFKEIESESGKEKFGVAIVFIYQKGKDSFANYPTLVFRTDSNTIQLSDTYCHLSFPESLKPRDGNVNGSISLNFIDNEMMKLLCDSSHLTMSLLNCSSTIDSDYGSDWVENEEKTNYKDIPVDELLNYARVFYRSIIDNSAYPDAVINGDESSEALEKKKDVYDVDDVDDDMAIRLITEDTDKWERIKPRPGIIEQYKGLKGLTITHIDALAFIDEKTIKLKALSDKNGDIRFFFIYEGGWWKLKKDLNLIVNMENHEVRYLQNDNDKYVYEVDASVLKEMLTTKHDVSLEGRELESVPQRKWQEAFEYLTDSNKMKEWLEQYEENDQSGIFGKIKNLFG